MSRAPHLPGKPQLEGIRPPPTLDGLIAQVILSVQLVRLEEIRGSAGVGLLQDAGMPRQKNAALQRHPLQAQHARCAACSCSTSHLHLTVMALCKVMVR